MVALQIIAAIILLLSINYFSSRYVKSVDLTQHADFTLSEVTQNYLKSEALSSRESPVKIIVAFRKSSPHYARIKALIRHYQELSSTSLEIEFVDPIRDAERARQVADYYEIHFTEDLVIIDADKTATEVPESDEKPAIQNATSHRRIVTVDDWVIQKSDRNNQLKVIGYQDEDAITAALIGAIEGKPRKIYFLRRCPLDYLPPPSLTTKHPPRTTQNFRTRKP